MRFLQMRRSRFTPRTDGENVNAPYALVVVTVDMVNRHRAGCTVGLSRMRGDVRLVLSYRRVILFNVIFVREWIEEVTNALISRKFVTVWPRNSP
jgi:hypothetical protein